MLLAVIAVVAGAAAGVLAGRLPQRGVRPRPQGASGSRRRRPWPGHLLSPVGGVDAIDVGLLLLGLLAAAAGRLPWAGGAAGMSVTGDALLGALAGRHWRHPGAILVTAGLAANLVVTAIDGGMPVDAALPLAGSGLHHQLTTGDHLRGLVDVIQVPLLGIVASPGDLLLCAGAAVAAFWLAWQIEHLDGAATPNRPAKGAGPA